jgi:hypothetical protein
MCDGYKGKRGRVTCDDTNQKGEGTKREEALVTFPVPGTDGY